MIPPKEKANELFGKYYNRIEHTLSEEYSPHEKFIVAQCAIIGIDEMQKFIDDQMQGFLDSDWLSYWQQVKQEIEKI